MLDENTKNLPSDNLPDEVERTESNIEDKESPKDEKQPDSGESVEEAGQADPKEVPSPVNGKEEEVAEKTEEVIEQTGEVENKEAESKQSEEKVSEEKQESVKVVVPAIQFAKLSLDDLAAMLEDFLREYDIRDIRKQIEDLRSNFNKKFKALLKEMRAEYLSQGGEESGFFYDSPAKAKFDSLMREYKKRRQQYYKDIEREQKQNLELKLALIEELKGLIDTAEPATMYKSFKELQERWRAVGQIPRADYNDVWRTYHHHVERFYDLLHLNNDFRDLDFKHNLEEKTRLVETAEELAESEDVNHAFKELQILHRLWKEEIGPVAREHREEIWNRFSEATKKIHHKRHALQDILEERYKANVDLKLAVIEKIRAMELDKIDTHKLWQEQIRKLEQLREEFFAIGKIPKSKSEEVWQKFRSATKEFNSSKNKFYKSLKKDQSENLRKKMELVEKAESLKDSEEWEEATEIFKNIQAEWKTIGHVPRKESDQVWKRFKEACNHYFDRLHEKKSDITKDQAKAIDAKKGLLDEMKSLLDSKELSMEGLEAKIGEWREHGAIPAKLKHLESKFGKLLDTAYKKLGLDKEEADFMKFKNAVDGFVESNNRRKLDSEQLFVRKKIDELTREIKQLENNISFISNASEDNPLVKNVYQNIEDYKQELELWKRKLDYLSRLEY